MNPDILIVDEVLSVGDASFRARCCKRMAEYRDNGGTVVFISHNTLAVEQVCQRVIWLDSGSIHEEGPSTSVIEAYESKMLRASQGAIARLQQDITTTNDEQIGIVNVAVLGTHSDLTGNVAFGETFDIAITFKTNGAVSPQAMFGIGIRKGTNSAYPFASTVTMAWDGVSIDKMPNEGTLTCRIKDPNLTPGNYVIQCFITVGTTSLLGDKFILRPHNCASFQVTPGALRKQLPTIPAVHLTHKMPTVVLQHDWYADGFTLVRPPHGT